MKEPNKEPMIKWVKELYSSDLKQAKGFLTLIADGERSYCCLGVACEIFKNELESVKLFTNRTTTTMMII